MKNLITTMLVDLNREFARCRPPRNSLVANASTLDMNAAIPGFGTRGTIEKHTGLMLDRRRRTAETRAYEQFDGA